MHKELQSELDELIDTMVPPLIDLDQLDRLVADDDNPDTFDGECAAHFSCTAISVHRLD
jgi:hypothetical protein